MAYKSKLFPSLNVAKAANAAGDDSTLSDLMANPEYLRHSSTIINDALKEGFDVLQLPNGDIVTTGTKIVTNNFVWDASKGKLVKSRAGSEKPRSRAKAKETIDEEADE